MWRKSPPKSKSASIANKADEAFEIPASLIMGEKEADGIYMPLSVGRKPGHTIVALSMTVPVDEKGIAFGALRRAEPKVEPVFYHVVVQTIIIPGDASHVAGIRARGFWSWSNRQWRDEVGLDDFAAIVGALKERALSAERHNAAEAEKARSHPVNIRAQEQIKRQAAIEANMPTAEVDRYICRTTGRTLEQLASYSQSTRGKLRRQARREMSAA